jgi:hypothetical protein
MENDLGYYQLPAFIMLDKELSSNEKLLIAVLNRRKHQRGYCFASNSHLIQVLNISLRTLTGILKSLEERGYIVREMTYREGTKEVELRKIFLTEKSEFATPMAKVAHTPMKESGEGYGNNCTRDIAKVAQDNKQYNKESNKEVKKEESALTVAAPLPAVTKPKTTLFNKRTSLSKEQYLSVLNDARLADGDRDYLLHMVEEMEDWSQAGGKRKACWLATLRNWVRRSRKDGLLPHGKGNKTLNGKQQPKSFAQIDAEWQEQEDLKFKQLMRKAEEEGYDFIRE